MSREVVPRDSSCARACSCSHGCCLFEDVILLRDTPHHEPELVSVSEYLQGFLPESLQLRGRALPDRSSKDTWFAVICSANYSNEGVHNHWVPGWSREQLTEGEFRRLCQQADQELTERIKEVELSSQLLALELEDASDEQMASLVARVQSMQLEIQRLLVRLQVSWVAVSEGQRVRRPKPSWRGGRGGAFPKSGLRSMGF